MSTMQSFWKVTTTKQVIHYIEADTMDDAQRRSLDPRIAREYKSANLRHPGKQDKVEPFDLNHPIDIIRLGCYLFQSGFFDKPRA